MSRYRVNTWNVRLHRWMYKSGLIELLPLRCRMRWFDSVYDEITEALRREA